MSDSIAATFGELLRAARKKAGLTQEALAHLSGMNRTTIGQLERGDASPRLPTIIQLAGALGIEPSALLPDIRWNPPSDSPRPTGRFQARD